MYFPLVAEEPTQNLSSLDSPGPLGGETILVCEDDPSVRKVAATFLASGGYRVVLSSSAAEALAEAKGNPSIALLLTDVVMPEMNGVELARSLRALLPELRVVYMSGYTANILDSRAGKDAVAELLPKPFTRTDLLRRVREALDDGQQPSLGARGQ